MAETWLMRSIWALRLAGMGDPGGPGRNAAEGSTGRGRKSPERRAALA